MIEEKSISRALEKSLKIPKPEKELEGAWVLQKVDTNDVNLF